MKNRLAIFSLAAALLVGLQPLSAADSKSEVKCIEVIARLRNDVAADPTRVLMAVEDALTTNDSCTCEIIKTAISTSKADNKLVGEIVSTAIAASPTTASTIGECALTTAPGAAKEIKAAMQNALGQGDGVGNEAGTKSSSAAGKAPVSSGKEPVAGKEIVIAPPVTPDDDYAIDVPLNATGIYLSLPAGGVTSNPKKKPTVKIVRTCDCRPKKHRPHTGSSGATKS